MNRGHVLPSIPERRSTGASPFISHVRLKISATLGAVLPDPPPAIEDVAMLNKQLFDKQPRPTNKRSDTLLRWRVALAAATVLTAVGFALVGSAAAGEIKDEPRWKERKDFSSVKDWNLKGENIVPHGVNPLY